MTKSELLAQAEVLEWALRVPASEIAVRALEVRAKADEAADIPIVDGSKPYYVEVNGVRRKYLPDGEAADPQPVAWLPKWKSYTHLHAADMPPKGFEDQWVALYVHPDPRIAELEQDLAIARSFPAALEGLYAGDKQVLLQRIAEYRELLAMSLEHMDARNEDCGLDIIHQRIRAALEKP